MKHTQEQIVESISRWTNIMLENGMVTEQEAKSLLGEGLFKRAIGAIKRTAGKVKQTASSAKKALKDTVHDLFKPNDGVKKMLEAMQKLSNGKVKLDGVKIYATLGDQTYPVKDFAMQGKKKLVLIVDKTSSKVDPKTLSELRKFLHEKLGKAAVKDAIEGIYCAEATNVLFESKLSDYIESNNLSKKEALKPETIQQIKKNKIMKQKDDVIKDAIEKYFAKKDTTGAAKKPDTKKSSGTSSKEKKTTSKDANKDLKKKEDLKKKDVTAAKDEQEVKPIGSDSSSKPNIDKTDQPILTLFDNTLLDVAVEKDNIGFVFSKSKKQIQLDKEYADQFSI